ncbi:linalool dehydratase/isomerase domain-containing protein [Nocardia sp. R7R-8]|uniref:linalool dehydratase/isomerase domain-containing protein n=1 Tax=Nocardia sp. R7R-8 TaxID=3459304 RepID=UPI00403E1282
MTTTTRASTDNSRAPNTGFSYGPMTKRWRRRTLIMAVVFWAVAAFAPTALGLGEPWRAFGAGLVVPGASMLYSIPALDQTFGATTVLGHAALLLVEVIAVAWLLRRRAPVVAVAVALAGLGAIVAGVAAAPVAVVVAGHVAGFLGVLVSCFWAFGLRLIPHADFVTLPVIVVATAALGAGLTAHHGSAAHTGHPVADHQPTSGPMTWVPVAAFILAVTAVALMALKEARIRRAATLVRAERERLLAQSPQPPGPARTDVVPLGTHDSPIVGEAGPDELKLLRYLMSTALQPVDNWDSYDKEIPAGPVSRLRYQLNALGWALATYNYTYTPAYSGALTRAQVMLFERMQRKEVWGYWYWQNLLGNYDFFKRRADPIDVPQNIMFSGYLNLQLGMFKHATGDDRYDRPGALVFDWSARQRFAFDHSRINDITLRNFDQDLCLWPCEPAPLSLDRTRGYVFPYCNAVATAGIGVLDGLNGTDHAARLAPRVADRMDREFRTASGDLVAFMVSGTGISPRLSGGPTTTAGISTYLAPLQPEFGRRSWEVLRREWLDTGKYREANSAGPEIPDWSTGAKTNAEPLAAAMLLARECGEREWHDELWKTALDQLEFTADPDTGLHRFQLASVRANGMLGFGGFGNGPTLATMMSTPRPAAWNTGPRLTEVPHPEVLVARAVSDGAALDLVLHPGSDGGRYALRLDRLVPGARYRLSGAVEAEIVADADGCATVTVDLSGRHKVAVRPN